MNDNNPNDSYDQNDEEDDGAETYLDPNVYKKDLTNSLYEQQNNPNLYRSQKSSDSGT
jgi:hypothetical protein